jgi:hypothetical protein
MEVKTFYHIFNISDSITSKLIIPKGIETIDPLPVELVVM